jgi:ABC-type molybdate transport system substrate-binding protein
LNKLPGALLALWLPLIGGPGWSADAGKPPMVYPIALTKGAKAGAAEFVAYVRGPAAETPFKTYGFTLLH